MKLPLLIQDIDKSFTQNDAMLMVAASSIILLILLITVISLFLFYQQKKIKFILDKKESEKRYLEELSKSQLETQEQTFKNIGWELHDNVGQLLSVANMQLNVLSTKLTDDLKPKLKDSQDVLKKSLAEVRALSKSLNSDVIKNLGLIKSIENELNRFNKLKFLNANLTVKGEDNNVVNEKDQIIIFRIIQEFFSNSIKHSKAKNLNVELEYLPDELFISITDDGVGFNEEAIKKGSGLINMKSRAELINADFDLKSLQGKGVSLTLNYTNPNY